MSIMKRNYRIRRQCEEDVDRPFTCGDSDLDDFFKNDSLHYYTQKLATSYVVEAEDAVLAYFSIANDRSSIEDFYKSAALNRFRKRFVNTKRIKGYPAVKLCRLAVTDFAKGQGIGTEIVNFLKGTFYKKQRSACRFLLVDSYKDSVKFYLKNSFAPINDIPDLQKHTIPMYFDLAELDIH